MVSNIIYKKKLGIPWLSVIFIFTCTILYVATLIDRNIYYIFATYGSVKGFWQYISGAFQHSIYPSWFLSVHFFVNMSVAIMFGFLSEWLLGTKKFAAMCLIAHIVTQIYFFATCGSSNSSSAGFSGIAWAFSSIGFYAMLRDYKNYGKAIFKNRLYIARIIELVFIWIVITAISPISTGVVHFVSALTGVVFLFMFKKDIDDRINKIYHNQEIQSLCEYKKNRWVINSVFLIPLLIVGVLVAYISTDLSTIFAKEVNISKHATIEEINNNDSKIEIEYDDVFTDNGVTSIKSSFNANAINFDLKYSLDRQTVIIDFQQDLPHDVQGEITLLSGGFESGRMLRSKKINIDVK